MAGPVTARLRRLVETGSRFRFVGVLVSRGAAFGVRAVGWPVKRGPSRRAAYRRLRGRGICPVARRAAAFPSRTLSRLPVPPATWPGESVPGGAGGSRDDTARAFVGRGGRRHRPAYLGGRSLEVESGAIAHSRGLACRGIASRPGSPSRTPSARACAGRRAPFGARAVVTVRGGPSRRAAYRRLRGGRAGERNAGCGAKPRGQPSRVEPCGVYPSRRRRGRVTPSMVPDRNVSIT